MKNIFLTALVIIFVFFITQCCYAKTQSEEYQNDTLYSQEYFDYLIECASIEQQELAQKEKEAAKKAEKEAKKNKITGDESSENIAQEDGIYNINEPFELRIENREVLKYTETYKKEDTKTIIPITSKFSLTQDTSKFKNKYNSNDYRVSTGAEYKFNKYFNLSSGLETNYRNLDQTPISKKIYITPTLKLSSKFSVSFINKLNTQTKSQDHDISLNFSPFKSNKVDLKVYAGLTKSQSGSTSQSVSFYTNFYF